VSRQRTAASSSDVTRAPAGSAAAAAAAAAAASHRDVIVTSHSWHQQICKQVCSREKILDALALLTHTAR